MKILIIEDEQSLAESINNFLNSEGHICEIASDYNTAIEKITIYLYDIIIVDITLPDGNGLNIISELKKKESKSGIIVISARDSVEQKIEGLEIGADDYLAKPFHLVELNARVKSLNRRVNFQGKNSVIYNEITIIPDEHKVFINDKELKLTKKEFDLLIFFTSNRDRVLAKTAISEHIWGDYMDFADSHDFIYTHIKNLRKKMTKAGCKDYIKTVYSVGYKFSLE